MDILIKKNLINSYNKQAMNRDSMLIPDWKTKERDHFMECLINENKKNILEIGAGPGRDSLYFKENGMETMSIDLSPEMVRLCKEKGLNAKVMSFENLDFPDECVDSIWALNCLLHVPKSHIREVLAEIRRVLKPSALFYLGLYGGMNWEGVWPNDSYEPKRFFSFFEEESIKELLADFLEVEYFNVLPASVVGGSLSFQSIILRK
ncbi:methyltransferase domain-containing protein [Ornithinibacillus sp. L9]|uniref:Methyltransferase domain-containing protein n=1 Tax=Ornithinibacillus caprae TaxID=2678566 RepID=A0A6N8FH49_9BACI|nr:class I SAM-dependent methyltransferase [Ornithinibacillus caprae]MUK88900.1 methyltransferase domain-containing protein [Ornithinibacillus caprae]